MRGSSTVHTSVHCSVINTATRIPATAIRMPASRSPHLLFIATTVYGFRSLPRPTISHTHTANTQRTHFGRFAQQVGHANRNAEISTEIRRSNALSENRILFECRATTINPAMNLFRFRCTVCRDNKRMVYILYADKDESHVQIAHRPVQN